MPRGEKLKGKWMKKYSHITDTERVTIEHSLKGGMPLKRIAERIGKHHATVAREIRAGSVASGKGACGRITNRCAERRACQKIQLCMDKPDCTRRCAACRDCNALCPDFREETCAKLGAAPYVCNGYRDERECVLRKRHYIHSPAHKHYRGLLVKSREGTTLRAGCSRRRTAACPASA